MSPLIRQRVDAAKLAARGTHINEVVAVGEFPRLSLLVESDEATVTVELAFSSSGVAGQPGIPLLDGKVETRLTLLCQRCLEPVELPLACAFHLALLEEDVEAEAVPPPYEPIVRDEEPQRGAGWYLIDLVEDELLLSLPFSPAHEKTGECRRQAQSYSESTERQTPFAGLKDLIMEK